MADKKKLPIGIQTFSKLRTDNDYYYVDKTAKIIELINESDYIFLSRPRRFGKSLTLDTIAELFSGSKDLFVGLYAEHHWDWQTKYPVIRFNFAKGVEKTKQELANNLVTQVKENADALQISLDDNESFAWLLNNLINQTAAKYQSRVVLLIDEYDKPILDNLENDEVALQMRDGLRDFYSVIKGQDANIRFTMLTGVSKFSKINLFSGLNNLLDVTLDERYSALCGYTQTELESVFTPELSGVNLAEVKRWYNGYNWGGESVYNPFDVLLFLNHPKKILRSYWMETGSPTFLIDKLVNEQVDVAAIKHQIANDALLSAFEVGDISPIALMFQTGYLTIDEVTTMFGVVAYTLKFPNMEVQQSLNALLLDAYLGKKVLTMNNRSALYLALLAHDLDKIKQALSAFFASIPHAWHRNNTIAHYEGYWASVFYALFASLGLDVIAEDSTNKGNIDLTVLVDNHIYIFEFKVLSNKVDATTALTQIQNKGYVQKYQTAETIIHSIGVAFDKDSFELTFAND
ncbi:ATP-binding protein (plasmid) [Moraxella bovis]|uniref:ATP-binding protein n=1 Tax=Moraxella bovis TaxID=476 RepID=A0ABY6ME91_MORBO|nr:ATP-binding protein [Moraxella bovis]UZA04797.1 ATP-binding protein [Moraxella bovis]